MICERCDGAGGYFVKNDQGEFKKAVQCSGCKGSGRLSDPPVTKSPTIAETITRLRETTREVLKIMIENEAQAEAMHEIIDAVTCFEMAHLYLTDKSYKDSSH